MNRKYVIALIFPLLLIFTNRTIAQQQQPTARGIFDSQINQQSAPNTLLKPRLYLPKRSKVGKTAKPVKTLSTKFKPLAIRYSVMMLGKENPKGYELNRNLTKISLEQEGKPFGVVDPDKNFQEGDLIYLVFEPSTNGYLYVVNLGSDETTRTLIYPDKREDALVTSNNPVIIGPFRIDPPEGIDKLTLVFSHKRIASFEDPTKDFTKSFNLEINTKELKTIEEV
ncbi:MAG: DUF4384 domain-containing protein [Blastocatellia bacterium]|nr:DUF4384 domain-containing protein [Blastocatellia bacterium]